MELSYPLALKWAHQSEVQHKIFTLPSPIVLCVFPNDPADRDGSRFPAFALTSKQLQRDVLSRREPLPS